MINRHKFHHSNHNERKRAVNEARSKTVKLSIKPAVGEMRMMGRRRRGFGGSGGGGNGKRESTDG